MKGQVQTCLMAVLMLAGLFNAGTSHAVNIGVFGDASISTTTEDGVPNSAAIGGLDLYATQDIDDKSKAFFETVFENDGSGFVLDVERLFVARDFTNYLQAGVGRFHSPLGYWNRHYHHGVLMQDTLSRPGFLEFEDADTGILPMHAVGLMATGDVPVIGGTFGYTVMVGNGSSIDSTGSFQQKTTGAIKRVAPASFSKPEIDVNNVSDFGDQKMYAARATFAPTAFPVEVGIFGMKNKVRESGDVAALNAALIGRAGAIPLAAATGAPLVDQVIFGVDAKVDWRQFGFLGEFYNINNNNIAGPSNTGVASAAYLQFSYNIFDPLKVIYRFETLNFDANNDTYFTVLNTAEGNHHVAELRYEFDDSNALYFEANVDDQLNGPTETTYALDWAFLMF